MKMVAPTEHPDGKPTAAPKKKKLSGVDASSTAAQDIEAHKKEVKRKSASHANIESMKNDYQGVQLLQLQARKDSVRGEDVSSPRKQRLHSSKDKDVASSTQRESKETQKEELHVSKGTQRVHSSRDKDVTSPTQRKTHETGKEEQHVSKGKKKFHSSRGKGVASSTQQETKETQKEEHRVSKGTSSSTKASAQKNNAKDGLFSNVFSWISQAFGR